MIGNALEQTTHSTF